MAGPLASFFSQIAQQQPMPTGTRLSLRDEAAYQKWKATLPQRLQYEGDYDLRGFYKKNPTFNVDDPEQHMTDEFKLPNHQTFSDESKYYSPSTARFGGHWTGDVFEPNSLQYKQRVDESQPPPGVAPLPRQYTGPIDWLFNKPPAAPTPSFRGPEMDAGPAPPTGRGPLASMFGKDKKKHE